MGIVALQAAQTPLSADIITRTAGVIAMQLSRLPRRTRLTLTGLAVAAGCLTTAAIAGIWAVGQRGDFALWVAAGTAVTICGTGWTVRVSLARAVQAVHGVHEELLIKAIADLTQRGGDAPAEPLRRIR